MSRTDSNPERFPAGERVSIYRRGNTWYANWQKDGRQYRRSLQTRSKKEAILRAQQIERDLDAPASAPVVHSATVRQAIEEFLRVKESEDKAASTMTKYRIMTRAIEGEATRLGRQHIDQLDQHFADRLRSRLHAIPVSQETIHDHIVMLRSLVLFAYRRRLSPSDPLAGMKLRKPKPKPQPVWTPEDADRIVAEAPAEYRSFFLFLRDTGCRVGEAKFLTWADVDLEQGFAHIRPKDGWKPKSGDQRAVPLSGRLRSELKQLSRPSRWVFNAPCTARDPKPRQVDVRASLESLKKILGKMKLEGHQHTYRHTFISQALSSGVPEAVVRAWVGHVDSEILRLYTHISQATSKVYIEKLEGTGGPGWGKPPGNPTNLPGSGPAGS